MKMQTQLKKLVKLCYLYVKQLHNFYVSIIKIITSKSDQKQLFRIIPFKIQHNSNKKVPARVKFSTNKSLFQHLKNKTFIVA